MIAHSIYSLFLCPGLPVLPLSPRRWIFRLKERTATQPVRQRYCIHPSSPSAFHLILLEAVADFVRHPAHAFHRDALLKCVPQICEALPLPQPRHLRLQRGLVVAVLAKLIPEIIWPPHSAFQRIHVCLLPDLVQVHKRRLLLQAQRAPLNRLTALVFLQPTFRGGGRGRRFRAHILCIRLHMYLRFHFGPFRSNWFTAKPTEHLPRSTKCGSRTEVNAVRSMPQCQIIRRHGECRGWN
mmetsp:Transcript_9739/g.23108  ORF Transcript_9739/g.23108 Transcript_9739/m.23108 type:complete len:239 (-) Transcript_9739:270-986(-)